MRGVHRVEGADEPAFLGDVEAWQGVEEVRLVDGSWIFRLVEEIDLGPDERDVIRITASEIRDVEPDAWIAAIRPALALTLFEEQLQAPRAARRLAGPDLVMLGPERVSALPGDEFAAMRDLHV